MIAAGKEQWVRDLEAQLTGPEREYMHRAIAKMDAEQLTRVAQLSPDAAAAALRHEMRVGPCPPVTLTTREHNDDARDDLGFCCDRSRCDSPDDLLKE